MRKRMKAKAEVPDWDPASGKWKTKGGGSKSILQTIAAWLFSLAILAAAMYLFKKAGESEQIHRADTAEEVQIQPDNPVSVPLMLPEGNESGKVSPPVETEGNDDGPEGLFQAPR